VVVQVIQVIVILRLKMNNELLFGEEDLLLKNIEKTLTRVQQSQIRLDLKFNKQTTENLIALVLCQLDVLVEIEGLNKSVVVDKSMV